MKRPYQIMSALFFVFSIFIVWQSIELRYYTSLGPGPGFFPFWLSSGLAVLSAVMFYQATWGGARKDPMPVDFFASRVGYFRIAAITVATAAVVVTMEPLGFRISMLGYLLFLLFALGRVNLIATVVVALAGSFGVYHVFVQWLAVPLPVGMFGI
jgi:putative tricarboxylic transport membrane protein